MKATKIARIGGGVVAMSLLLATQASATIAYDFKTGLAGNQQGGPYSLGTVFNVSSPINVVGLGAFDQGGDGIGGAGIDVAIYQITLSGTAISSGTLVTPSVHFSGTGQTLLSGNDTRVASISPVTLGAGTYMVVANQYGPSGSEVNYNPYYVAPQGSGANPLTANAAYGVTYAGGYFITSPSLTWGASLPSAGSWSWDNYYTGSPQDPRYAAGNFDFTPVPEAATFGAAAVGLLGLVYVARYVRSRRALSVA